MGSSIPTFGTWALDYTPIAGSSSYAGRFGSIFVPISLLASYKTAPGWSSLSSRIVGI